MHQEIEGSSEAQQRVEAEKRRQQWEWWYQGWTAFMAGKPKFPKGIWGIEALRFYVCGWVKAEKAAKEFREGH